MDGCGAGGGKQLGHDEREVCECRALLGVVCPAVVHLAVVVVRAPPGLRQPRAVRQLLQDPKNLDGMGWDGVPQRISTKRVG
jgi:hypothetical protein